MDIRKLADQLTRHEGLRLKPYRCPAGKLTIGIGRNLDDCGISEHEAKVLLFNDIRQSEVEAREIIKNFENLSDVRQGVIVNMIFNMGAPTFRKFKNLIAAIETDNYKKAGKEMLDSRWARQVGNRAIELSKQMEGGAE